MRRDAGGPPTQEREGARDCDWHDERIEAYVDGELSPGERRRLEAHVHACPECAETMRLAADVKRSLGSLPTLWCPDRVIEAVEREVRADLAAEPSGVFRHDPRGQVSRETLWRRVAAVATLAACLALVWRPAPPDNSAEVERLERALAELQTKLSDRATFVGRETFQYSVAKPVRTVSTAVRESPLGDWGARASTWLAPPVEAAPPETSEPPPAI